MYITEYYKALNLFVYLYSLIYLAILFNFKCFVIGKGNKLLKLQFASGYRNIQNIRDNFKNIMKQRI